MRKIVYFIGAGLSKSLQNKRRIPLMGNFVHEGASLDAFPFSVGWANTGCDIRVLKPHGSVNWLVPLEHPFSHTSYGFAFEDGPTTGVLRQGTGRFSSESRPIPSMRRRFSEFLYQMVWRCHQDRLKSKGGEVDSQSQPKPWESKLAPNALEAIAFARDNLPKLLEYCCQTFSGDQIEEAGIRDLDWTSYYRDMAASRELQLFLNPEESKKFAEELTEAFGDDRQAVFFCNGSAETGVSRLES